jgi:hypothetical protein
MMVFLALVLRPELPELALPELRLGADEPVADGSTVGVEVKVCATRVPLTVLVLVTRMRVCVEEVELSEDELVDSVVVGAAVV